jgi:hypothetical protein
MAEQGLIPSRKLSDISNVARQICRSDEWRIITGESLKLDRLCPFGDGLANVGLRRSTTYVQKDVLIERRSAQERGPIAARVYVVKPLILDPSQRAAPALR